MRRPFPTPHLGLGLAIGVIVFVTLGVACGGGGSKQDGPITEDEAAQAMSHYLETTIGLFSGSAQPQTFIDLFAPECRENVDASSLALVVTLIQGFAPGLKDVKLQGVDVGKVTLQKNEQGTLVSLQDPTALRVKVDGNFKPVDQFFADAGFEATGEGDLEEPLLLVRRNGKVYLGDCSGLDDLSGGLAQDSGGSSPTPASGPGSSRAEPVPLGDSAVVEDTWELKVVDVNPDAWDVIKAESDFNDPAGSGRTHAARYALGEQRLDAGRLAEPERLLLRSYGLEERAVLPVRRHPLLWFYPG